LRPGIGWQALAYAGTSDNLTTERWYEIKAEVVKKHVRLFVDKILVLDHVLEEEIISGQVGLFTFGGASVHFKSFSINSCTQTVFVVMQFT
jgi:hypothetical protein